MNDTHAHAYSTKKNQSRKKCVCILLKPRRERRHIRRTKKKIGCLDGLSREILSTNVTSLDWFWKHLGHGRNSEEENWTRKREREIHYVQADRREERKQNKSPKLNIRQLGDLLDWSSFSFDWKKEKEWTIGFLLVFYTEKIFHRPNWFLKRSRVRVLKRSHTCVCACCLGGWLEEQKNRYL